LAALLDAALRTPLARRQPVPLAAADALLAAWEATLHGGGPRGSRSVGVNAVLTLGTSETSEGTGLATTTGGGLAPLG
jgi:hypothetical protein